VSDDAPPWALFALCAGLLVTVIALVLVVG
jgi:hypothetical protein